jgi:hypothetical protein
MTDYRCEPSIPVWCPRCQQTRPTIIEHADDRRLRTCAQCQRIIEELGDVPRLSPYDVARWFDVPPHLITNPELTDGKK